MDSKSGTSSANKSPLWGIRFRHWLGGVLVDMRRKSPVQQWVDSIPRQDQKPVVRATSQDDISVTSETANQVVSPIKSVNIQSSSAPVCLNKRDKFLSSGSNEDSDVFEMGTSARTDACEPKLDLYSSSVDSTLVKRTKPPFFRDRSINSEGNSPRHKNALFRDSSLQRGVSFQSEGATSRASSVESLLESRRVDAEAVLRGVGFGPSPARQQLARIPDRFLKPSQVKGVSTEQFIKEEQKSMKLHECGVFGYRGLTGHPHVPPSSIVAKIIERISSSEEIPDPRILHSSGQAAPRQSDIDTF